MFPRLIALFLSLLGAGTAIAGSPEAKDRARLLDHDFVVSLYWRYLGGSDVVHEFERNLRLTDTVLRFYTVKVDEDVDPAARPSEITEDLLENISEPPPEPEPEPVREVEEENSMYADDGVEGLEEGVS